MMEEYTQVEKGKETDYFSKETVQLLIEDIANEIKQQKKVKKFYKGAISYQAIKNLEGKEVDVWIEWDARRKKGLLDIGITNCIFHKKDTFPDIVLDRWNKVKKEIEGIS